MENNFHTHILAFIKFYKQMKLIHKCYFLLRSYYLFVYITLKSLNIWQ